MSSPKCAGGFLLASALLLLPAINQAKASPIPISGSLSFLGNAAVNTGDLATATAFTSFSGDYVDQTSGSYLTIPSLTDDPVTFPSSGFTFRTGAGTMAAGTLFSSTPAAPPLTTLPLWTFTAGGVTYDFMASGTINVSQNSQFLNISGDGIADITGGATDYLPTSGTWTITETNTGASFSFGATSGANLSSAPDVGGTNLLLVLGVVGLALGLAAQRRPVQPA